MVGLCSVSSTEFFWDDCALASFAGICTEESIEDATATTGGTATYRWATTSKNEESRTDGFILGEQAKQN
eukprot:jgi/Botrbrau1/14825/Bobra.168_3s0007.1